MLKHTGQNSEMCIGFASGYLVENIFFSLHLPHLKFITFYSSSNSILSGFQLNEESP